MALISGTTRIRITPSCAQVIGLAPNGARGSGVPDGGVAKVTAHILLLWKSHPIHNLSLDTKQIIQSYRISPIALTRNRPLRVPADP